MLARGQTLSHEFTFTNTTRQPLHLTEAIALTPCCSQVGPLPESPIPRGGRCSIPVTLKIASTQRETRRVGFVVQTDSRSRPSLTYALRATIYPEWEIRAVGEPTRELVIGRAGRDVFQVTCHRVANDGGILPSRVEAEPPLTATFVDEPREQTDPTGLTSTSRDVEIRLPPLTRPGPNQGNVIFRWPEGRTQVQSVFWTVVLPVRVTPSKLVLRRSEREVRHTIALRTNDPPFRVTSVDPPHLVADSEFRREPSQSHTIQLRLDPDRLAREPDPKITIHTDHPDQPTLSLSVFVLPAGV